MKFFIDTASIDDIKEEAALGVLDGVSTNPFLVAKSGADYVSPFVGRLDDISTGGWI